MPCERGHMVHVTAQDTLDNKCVDFYHCTLPASGLAFGEADFSPWQWNWKGKKGYCSI
jgi:hypothetical protein